MSEFFINRPIFAWVIAILISLFGLFGILKIGVEQYPNVAPTSVSIRATLPGASSKTVESSVTKVIEEAMVGLEDLRYFYSNSSSDGTASINLIFEPNVTLDLAQIRVQNKLQTALPFLPQQVKDQGVVVSKLGINNFLFVSLISTNSNVTEVELNELLYRVFKEPISRIDGIGGVDVFSSPASMRVWLNPHKMNAYKVSVTDVVNAIKTHNIDVSGGQFGSLPTVEGLLLNAVINVDSKLQTEDDFKKIILRQDAEAGILRLSDVAKIEIILSDYSLSARYKGKPAAGIGLNLADNANVLKVAQNVKSAVKELEKLLPEGVEVVMPYDTTPFTSLAIFRVIGTLFEAFILVFLVMFLFLQNFRATFIVSIAIPIVLLGGVGVVYAFGFTINILTMFAMILAIGLLVDDAIVVVENIERIMKEERLSPKAAAIKSMKQIQGALIGITIVIIVLFIPMVFFGGSAGVIYKQFSVTIVSIMIISALVALILTPSLCAIILKNHDHSYGKIFNKFNQLIEVSKVKYSKIATFVAIKPVRFILVYGFMMGIIVYMFEKLPNAFLPSEDQGYLIVVGITPPLSTIETTDKITRQIEHYFEGETDVKSIYTINGFSFLGTAQNSLVGFVLLEDFKKRTKKEEEAPAILGRAAQKLSQIKDAFVFAIAPPPISGLGNASGFEMQLLDVGNLGREKLIEARNQLLFMASKSPFVMAVRPNGFEDTAQYKIDINYEKAGMLGVSRAEIANTISIAFGSSYVNDFDFKGKLRKVLVQSDPKYRMNPNDIGKWFVKNKEGEMVSLASFSTGRWIYGSPNLERFNGVSSINIQGMAKPGISSGDAMKEMERIASLLPKGISFTWSGLSYEEKASGSNTILLYAISILIVFLSLAALYESWSIPFAVIFSIPFGVIGALIFSFLFKQNNDIYFQVSLLTTMGLCAKNAILIVEFAKELQEKGASILEATQIALTQRFRPILMTSFAFMFGVVPLILASGAGSASQNALGVAVFGGMFTATFFLPLFVPLFFKLTQVKR